MRKFGARPGLAVAVALGMGLLAAPFGPLAAGAAPAASSRTPHGPTRLIDTNIVVGFPQHLPPSSVPIRGVSAAGFGGFGAPTITQQPTNQTVAAGATATFTAAASGHPTPTVQWYTNSGGNTFSAISGATSPTYSFTASSSQNGWEYEAVFRNFFGSATTQPATLTVTTSTPTAPTITQQPTNQTVAAGATATFTAAASGNPTPTVQWYTNSGGNTFSAISGATSPTYSFTASSSQNGWEYEAVFSNSAGSATTNTVTLTVTSAPTQTVQSSNWSGYADTNATFTAVKASWSVPTVTCPSGSNSYSAEWVGIDGYSSSTAEQDGISANCVNGSPSYYAWYEMYGDTAVNNGYEVELSPSSNPVEPGDSISASVSVTNNSWTLSITDSSSHGWTYSATFSFSAAQSSAEWIVERPEICRFIFCSLASLTDFGTVTFSSASTTTTTASGTISSNPDALIEMVNGQTVLAQPGPLDAAGDSFTDTWKASS